MSDKKYNVAVVGATGAVGIEMIKTLEDRDFPIGELTLLASARSAGKRVRYKDEYIAIQELTKYSFANIDYALFSAGGNISEEFAKYAVEAGAVVVDNSSAFRLDETVPLVVPEVNPEDAFKHKGIIANPNCSTIIMIVVAAPLHKAKKLKRIIASTYQATSGAGAKGMEELEIQTQQLLNGEPISPKEFAHRIAFNLIPHIDVFKENGYTKEELKMTFETRKMLHHPELQVSCTCVRVPILRAHSESLNLEFEDDITPEDVREILTNAPGVELKDNIEMLEYPMPKDAMNQYDVIAGRIRQDASRNDKKGIDIFVSGDQILKGAALNAIQIVELLISK